MTLAEYRRKRNFERTPEPEGAEAAEENRSRFLYVIQKHAAKRLHYDLRLELDGALKSWAVPKGPPLKTGEKRLAVHVEDHPLEYGTFEGVIPEGEYGGGAVMIWDRGEWEPLVDPRKGYRTGTLKFRLHGEKLEGVWVLVRTHGESDEGEKNWLLIKDKEGGLRGIEKKDIEEAALSAKTGRTLEEIAEARDAVWTKETITPSLLPGAKTANQPKRFFPQLAVAAKSPPEGDQWLHEIKYDGYRVLAFLKAHNARLFTRNGKDWTAKFGGVAEAVERLPVREGIFDGEVVVLKPDGTTDFQALQNVLQGLEEGTLAYYVFDIPRLNGYDLAATPLLERKRLLERLLRALGAASPIRYSDHIRGQGPVVYENACELALEGIVSKRVDSRYVQRRSRSWLKVKCLNRQEFVVGGYSEPSGARKGFGALLVGYFNENGGLVYSGRVGTGFKEQSLACLYDRLKALERETAPFENPPAGREARGVHWVSPELVAEIEFSAWTNEGVLRQPAFKGLREDRSPREISIERPVEVNERSPQTRAQSETPPAKPKRLSGRAKFAGVSLTNADRILYPDRGIAKRDLAAFYEEIEEWILPHIAKRPLTLLRCPEGRLRECFFQKHLDEALPKTLRGVPILEKEKEETYIVLDDLPGLISLVQLGVLEIHPWQSREDKVETPDRIIFDLDPGPEASWENIVACAGALRDRLLDLGLRSFVKTSGGKGLHVVVPLVRRSGWGEIKAFAKAVAEETARQAPQRFVSTMTKSKRKKKIYIDYVRNSRGATTVAAYSTRARAGAPVSTPVHWEELSFKLSPNQFTMENVPARLKTIGKDPWDSFFAVRQSLTKKVKRELGLRL